MNLILLGGSNWFYEIWNTLWLWVCSGIYYFIGLLYQVFEKVASVNLFNGEIFEKLTGRMYLVIGIAMLFILAYNIILAIINPDGKDKGTSQMTKVVKETIISLVLVVLLPTIFNYLYIFQTHVLESNIIGTIILGGVGSSGSGGNCEPTDYDCNCEFPSDAFSSYSNFDRWLIFFSSTSTSDITPLLEAKCVDYRDNRTQSQKGAYMVAPSVFSAFYRPTQFDFEECSDHIMGFSTSSVINGNEENEKICVNFFADVLLSKYTGNIAPFASDSYLTSVISDSAKNGVYMDFHWIMAIVAGILALYMFFCYAMEIGVRVAKLGFLQLISPIPVMMRIIPGQKEKIYKKWFDNLKNTYIDVFIRLAIIYFALFGVSLVPDVIGTMFNSVWNDETNFFIKLLVQVFVILGLLKFAQDAPQLFKEFFGGSGKFALKSPRKQLQENKLAMGGIGLAAGGAQNMLGNYYKATHDKEGNKINGSFKKGVLSGVGGLFGGARRGAIRGYKTNDFKNLGGELKQAKYETDEARAKREANKQYAAEHGYSGPLSSLYGGILQTKKGLETYIKSDGSGKVTANAAQNISKRFKNIDESYSSAELKRIKGRLDADTITIRKPADRQSFYVGAEQYKFQIDSGWTDADGNEISTVALETKNKDYVHGEELREKASIYSKRRDEFCVDLGNAMTYFSNNASNLPYDDLSKIINSLKTDVKVKDGDRIYKLPDSINSVDDLKSVMIGWAKSGDTGELMLVAELSDVLNKKMSSLSGTITGRTETADLKEKK